MANPHGEETLVTLITGLFSKVMNSGCFGNSWSRCSRLDIIDIKLEELWPNDLVKHCPPPCGIVDVVIGKDGFAVSLGENLVSSKNFRFKVISDIVCPHDLSNETMRKSNLSVFSRKKAK